MPLHEPVTPGVVDWTGENPGILLKDEKGEFSAMALFFRVAWSPVGQGHVLLLYGCPQSAEFSDESPNVLVSDNAALADFSKENLIAKLAAFRNAPAFDGLKSIVANTFKSAGDPMGPRYSESVHTDKLNIELIWEQLEEPRCLELTPDQVGTGEHTMFTLLVPAGSADIMVNGRSLPGAIGTRVQAGVETTTAFLYFSETWVIPPVAELTE